MRFQASSAGPPRRMISKMVSFALAYQASDDDRVDSRMMASGYASLIGCQKRRCRPVDRGNVAGEQLLPLRERRRFAVERALPAGNVVRPAEPFEHVVAGPAQELLEGQ